jgi:hypothetical protein
MKNRKKILELLDDAVELAQASQAKAMEAKSLLGEPESNITVLGFETIPDAQLTKGRKAMFDWDDVELGMSTPTRFLK